MTRNQRYGNFTGVWGACAAITAYLLAQLGIVPKTDIPFLIEAISTVLGGFAGFFHAWLTDKNGIQQTKDQE